MRKIAKVFDGLRGFMGEVQVEAHKSTWPTRKELVAHTGMVLVFVVLLGVYIGLSDLILLRAVRWLLG